MKSRVVKELKEKYGIRKINGRNIKSYDFYTLCFYLDQVKAEKEEK